VKVLDFVVKADTQGAAEALAQAVQALEAEDDKLQVKTRVLRFGAGAVTNEDVLLASVSVPSATVLGFGAKATDATMRQAQERNVDVRSYDIVYDALDDVRAQLAAEIRPPPSKQLGSLVGKLNVKQLFKISAVGKVAGCEIVEGLIRVGSNIRILRGNLIVYEGKLQSLRSGKDAAEQVEAPEDCGISFDDYQGMEVGDRVEVYAARDSQAAD
jgi:translation initiation factor IF-2